MGKRHIFLDIETSGLKPPPEGDAVILSIGAVAEVGGNKSEREFSEFYALICPTKTQWELAAQEALQVNGLTWETLQAEGKPFSEVREEFLRWAMENRLSGGNVVLVGQNPRFDLGFLQCYMGAELRFIGFPLGEPIDIRDLYSILVNRKVMPYLKKRDGHSISKALGVLEEPWPHNALEGARAVQRNYSAMLALGIKD